MKLVFVNERQFEAQAMRQGYQLIDLITDIIKKELRLVIKDIKEDMKKPKSGKERMIFVNGKLKHHVHSAPGESPAIITKTLYNSLKYEVNKARFIIGYYDVEYGLYLEFGTSKMKPRPAISKFLNEHFGKDGEKILYKFYQIRVA